MKRILLLHLFLFCCASAFTQLNNFIAYQKAGREIILLQNQNKLLPLQRLENKKVALITLEAGGFSVLKSYLGKYAAVAQEVAPQATATGLAREWADSLRQQYNSFVLAIRDSPNQQEKPLFYEFRRAFIRELLREEELAVLLYDYQQALDKLPELEEAPALVLAPYNYYGQALAAQLLFGGYAPEGRLNEALSPAFPRGSGLTDIPATRLGYAPPQAVGMHQQLLEDSIATIMEEGLAAGAYPGAQVLVARKGKIVYHQTFGYHTEQALQPVGPDDLYDLASVTKVSSALPALMRWYGEGQFDPDATLPDYLPDYRWGNKRKLTFRDMLTHQAGLRPWIPYWQTTLRSNARYPWKKHWDSNVLMDYDFRKHTLSTQPSAEYSVELAEGLYMHNTYKEQIYKAIRKSPLEKNPGYRYSGLLFYLLPELVARKSGTDYETYLKETFYQPLGAFSITFNPLRFYAPEQIIPTERDTFFRMMQLRGQVHDEGAAMMQGASANAGLFAKAEDLAKLFQLYLNGGTYGGERFISEAAVTEFTRCQYCGQGNHRGLGFDKPLLKYHAKRSSVAQSASPASFGHSGYTGTFVWADPEEDLLFIFLSNRVYPSRTNRKLYKMNIRPKIHQVLYDAIRY